MATLLPPTTRYLKREQADRMHPNFAHTIFACDPTSTSCYTILRRRHPLQQQQATHINGKPFTNTLQHLLHPFAHPFAHLLHILLHTLLHILLHTFCTPFCTPFAHPFAHSFAHTLLNTTHTHTPTPTATPSPSTPTHYHIYIFLTKANLFTLNLI